MAVRAHWKHLRSHRILPVARLVGMALVIAVFAACGGKSSKSSTTTTAQPTSALSSGSPAIAQATPFSLAPTTPTPFVRTQSPTPNATPTETPDDSPLAKLIIPKAKVAGASFVTIGIIASTNTMDSPKTKDQVGYYDFTPRPGYGGNTVLSGHVDWFTGEIGVFYYLKDLQTGDEIDVTLQDNKTYRYKVSTNQLYDAETAPVEEIIGDTPTESVTLITCEGVFNQASAEYNKRRVVRGVRVYS